MGNRTGGREGGAKEDIGWCPALLPSIKGVNLFVISGSLHEQKSI